MRRQPKRRATPLSAEFVPELLGGPVSLWRDAPSRLMLGLLLRHPGMIETGNPVNFKAIVFAAAASVALAGVWVTGASASGARTPQAVTPQAVTVTEASTSLGETSPGTQLWMKLFDNRGNGGALSEAVSPTGARCSSPGTPPARGAENDTTVAYNSVTGAQRWAKSYGGPGGIDRAVSVAVSPNGKAVFVTGYSSRGAVLGADYPTIAYNAATGAQLWVSATTVASRRRRQRLPR